MNVHARYCRPGPGRVRHALLLTGALGLVACAEPPREQPAPQSFGGRGYSTYVKYVPLARDGDPKYQNLIGFMNFFGEGAPLDREQAHIWFHLAAEQGYAPAERNLAIMHQLGLGAPRDRQEAERYAQAAGIADLPQWTRSAQPAVGRRPEEPAERAYATFCAGCHGLNGIAAFIDSPSFALGERMDKKDEELLTSIRSGRGVMPGWGGKLPGALLPELLAFVRGLERQYEAGIGQALRGAPDRFFLFGPMAEDDAAYRPAVEE